MAACHIAVLFAIFTTIHAGCTGGKIDGPNSRVVYTATRTITDVGTKPVICSFNQCKSLELTLNRVDISGDGWSCKDGGPGSFKVEIYVNGGNNRNFTGRIWATGKDRDVIDDPTYQYWWHCSLQELYDDYCPGG